MHNKANPLVSVAIITYNQKEFLKEAIESVLLQNYEPLQIVVGDDGSSDGTHELLEEYKKIYPGKFVLYLGKTNVGLTNNSNLVQDRCMGKYVAWLGGDDLMLPLKIIKQVEFLEKHPNHNIVYHNLDVFESSSNKHLYFFNRVKDKHFGGIQTMIKHGTFNGACSSMYRRSAAPPSPSFNPILPVASDWLYSVEHLGNGARIGFIDDVLGRYRRHSHNVSNSKSPLAMQGFTDTINSAEILLKKYPAYKKEVYYWYSTFYRGRRRVEYIKNLKKSLSYNMFNIKSVIMLMVHYLSFKRIKI